MRSPNKIIIAAAGGGKTTRIVDEVLADNTKRSAIITYTRNNISEIQAKFIERGHAIPDHVEIISWYRLLLREMARPYQTYLINGRIEKIQWVETTLDRFAPKTDVQRYYFGRTTSIYSNKLAEFVSACIAASNGEVIERLRQRFQRIYIDEIQDVAGYDIDVIEAMLRSNLEVIMVGDPRQSTYSTNNSSRHKGFRGPDILKKLEEWHRKKLAFLEHQVETHRCNQSIADLADSFYPSHEKTRSTNTSPTGHDGVFVIHPTEVEKYIHRFGPQILRLSVTTDCSGLQALNFGESKGMTFERVLIFPHKKALKWLETGDDSHIDGVRAELYVGVTRARHSVAFVYDKAPGVSGISRFP